MSLPKWIGPILIILLLALAAVFFMGYVNHLEWVGVSKQTISSSGSRNTRLLKTLWDWTELLLIPVLLFLAGVLFSREQQIAEQNRKAEHELARSTRQAEAFHSYIQQMTALTLSGQLQSSPMSVHSQVARVLTLATLKQVDSAQKRLLLEFLYESRLIDTKGLPTRPKGVWFLRTGTKTGTDGPVISLSGADFEGVNLEKIDLTGADLQRVNFTRAVMKKAKLDDSDLSRSELSGTDLREAGLQRTRLDRAYLTETDLSEATLSNTSFAAAHLDTVNLRGAMTGDDQILSLVESLNKASVFLDVTMPRGRRLANKQQLEEYEQELKDRIRNQANLK